MCGTARNGGHPNSPHRPTKTYPEEDIMRVNKTTIAALAVVAGLSLTACQNDDSASGSKDSGSSSVASGQSGSSSGKGESGSGGGSGSGSSTQNAGKDTTTNSGGGSDQGTVAGTGSNKGEKIEKCYTDELDVKAKDATVSGDDVGLVAVDFINNGGRDCTLSGYANVVLKTNAGSLSAQRTGEKADTVVLKDGETITFAVTYPINKTGGSGVRVTKLVVTPPNDVKSVTLNWPGGASLPAGDKAGTPVKVGPMGSAGQG